MQEKIKLVNKKEKNNFHVIYGRHAVKAVLQNPSRVIYKLFLQEDMKHTIEFPIGTKVEYVTRDRLERMCKDGDKHQGCVAHVSDLIESYKLDDYIAEYKRKDSASIVILDQINDPHNLGAILRSARCFSVDLIVITKYNMPPINASVIRSSAGMSEYVNILTVTNLNATIDALKSADFHVIGMQKGDDSVDIKAIPKSQKTVIVMGSEGSGLRPSVSQSCNTIAHIEIHPDSDSLNVSNAAAIGMYELFSKK